MLKMLKNWIDIIRLCNLTNGQEPCKADFISRWLMNIRACVFSMTLLSGLIGILLAIPYLQNNAFPWVNAALVILGLLFAHASNNLVNDYFDVLNKVDTPGYPRTEYAPHPLLSKMTTVRNLWIAIFLFNLSDLGVAIYLSILQGWQIMLFAVAGLALSVFYVAPPFRLKHNGLGEIAIFFIWGPLIIGGTVFALTGNVTWQTLLNSAPYGIAIVAVVLGKHLDKRVQDEKRNVHTIPVILGEKYGRFSMIFIIVLFYLSTIVLSVIKFLPWTAILTLLSIPKAWTIIKVLNIPMPKTPKEAHKIAQPYIPKSLDKVFNTENKEHFPLWPLWFVVWGVWWVRTAGALLVLGLILGLFL